MTHEGEQGGSAEVSDETLARNHSDAVQEEPQADRRPARIITVGGEKGGTGKTTIATNLAVCRALQGRDVLLVDTDKQGSASDWISYRDAGMVLPGIGSVQKFGATLTHTLGDLAKRYDDIIVDAGGRDSPEMRAAMTVSDYFLVPLQASSLDLWTLGKLNELTSLARPLNEHLRVVVMVNRSSTNPASKDTQKAVDFFKEFVELEQAESELHERIIYRRMALAGKGVVEGDDEKASQEMWNLYREIYGE